MTDQQAIQILTEPPSPSWPTTPPSPNPSASCPSTRPPSVDPLPTIDPQAIALTTGTLLATQTRIKFKHDSTGKWTFEIEKKSSGDGVVKEVVQRLLALLPK